MTNSRTIELSRTISHALRHQPWLYELELDEEGWVETDALLSALGQHRPEWQALTENDLQLLINSSDKRRFELTGGRIRALYGHSTSQKLLKVPATPPTILFHGTAPRLTARILAEGLKPMARQYVHLSTDQETAFEVGRRKARRPQVLQVAAAKASQAGVLFYEGNASVWLADAVPPEFISLWR